MLEIENYGSVKMIIGRDYETFSCLMLEAKAAAFMRATGEFKGYSLSYKGLSMTDM